MSVRNLLKQKPVLPSSLLATALSMPCPVVAPYNGASTMLQAHPQLCRSKTKHVFYTRLTTRGHARFREPRAKHGSTACVLVLRSLATPLRNARVGPSFMRTHSDPLRPDTAASAACWACQCRHWLHFLFGTFTTSAPAPAAEGASCACF
jgi:hypothetical protein